MEKPFIGIPMYPPTIDENYTLPEGYVEGVRRAGGTPLPLAPGEKDPAAWTDLLDGLILAGGGDVDPSFYLDNYHPSMASAPPERVSAERDRTELQVIQRAMARKIPILAICRGCQLLNVHLGGTLHLHVPDKFGDQIAHGVPAQKFSKHSVELSRGSLLEKKFKATTMEVFSSHHQSVDRVAAPLTVVGKAPDGCIEALDMEEYPWLVAVQWHPEQSAGDDPIQQNIFDQLVEVAQNSR
ncbi:MAG: gamma-glutamyl-gamma-aminobutyrate hydrolase family protein [Planctomycetota bacterium]